MIKLCKDANEVLNVCKECEHFLQNEKRKLCGHCGCSIFARSYCINPEPKWTTIQFFSKSDDYVKSRYEMCSTCDYVGTILEFGDQVIPTCSKSSIKLKTFIEEELNRCPVNKW